jgi:hypothetical protein
MQGGRAYYRSCTVGVHSYQGDTTMIRNLPLDSNCFNLISTGHCTPVAE